MAIYSFVSSQYFISTVCLSVELSHIQILDVVILFLSDIQMCFKFPDVLQSNVFVDFNVAFDIVSCDVIRLQD